MRLWELSLVHTFWADPRYSRATHLARRFVAISHCYDWCTVGMPSKVVSVCIQISPMHSLTLSSNAMTLQSESLWPLGRFVLMSHMLWFDAGNREQLLASGVGMCENIASWMTPGVSNYSHVNTLWRADRNIVEGCTHYDSFNLLQTGILYCIE